MAPTYTTTAVPDPRKDPRLLTSLSEILSCLSAFQSEEAELSNSLTHLLRAREPIFSSLGRLQSISPQLNELQVDASLLARKVSNTAETAERVGSRVRSLDEEMGRIREASHRVGQVMELKVTILFDGTWSKHADRNSPHYQPYKNLSKARTGKLQPGIVHAPWPCHWRSYLVPSRKSRWFVSFMTLSRVSPHL